jgi:hypothetical protein
LNDRISARAHYAQRLFEQTEARHYLGILQLALSHPNVSDDMREQMKRHFFDLQTDLIAVGLMTEVDATKLRSLW